MPLVSLCLAVLAPSAPAPVSLSRKFAANEKLAYAVHSHLTAEVRGQGLATWIPEDVDIDYGFSYTVTALKNDGFAVVKYLRPTWTETEGETYDSVPKPKVEKLNQVLQITVSPTNELTDLTDLTPKPKKPVKMASGARWAGAATGGAYQAPIFSEYIGEMHRLALFVGGVDSALDFAPKLPFEAVKVGDTWKRTVGYQPQKLKGKDSAAVQRIDYTYTYLGRVTSNGKSVERVQAKLNLDTDLVDYLKSLTEGRDLGIKTIPLKIDATIDFDLDPKTHHTLEGRATSEGGFRFVLRGQDDAVQEERFKGQTTLTLAGRKVGVK